MRAYARREEAAGRDGGPGAGEDFDDFLVGGSASRDPWSPECLGEALSAGTRSTLPDRFSGLERGECWLPVRPPGKVYEGAAAESFFLYR